MFLSRVQVDTHNLHKIKDLTHLGAYHNWVESSFPAEFKEKKRSRKLWRIDTIGNKKYLLLVSPDKPDLMKLSAYGVDGTAETTNYDKMLDCLKNDMIFRFRLVATPLYSKSSGKKSGKRGKVMQCLSMDDQLSYLEKRSDKNGFSLLGDLMVTGEKLDVLRKKHHKKGFIRHVSYEGHLKITDVDKFKTILCNGLGHKKAYGSGLMTIMPA